jgi:integrase
VFASAKGTPKPYRTVWSALDAIGTKLGLDLTAHDFRRGLASYLIVAARLDEGAVTGVLGHTSIETTRRIYAADWRDAEERNAIILDQLAAAGIGQ